MDDSSTKRCTKCSTDKPLDCFSKGSRFRDGLQPYCRACMRAYRAERAAETVEHIDKRRRQRSLYSPEERYQRQLAYNNARRRKPKVRAKERDHVRHQYHADPAYREWRKMLSRRHGAQSERNRRARYHVDPSFRQRLRNTGNKANQRYRQTPQGRAASKAHWRAYRARKVGAIGSHTTAEWDALCEHYGHICLACGQHTALTEDHIVPLSAGGTDAITNIQPLCRPCNSTKGTQTIDYRLRYAVGV